MQRSGDFFFDINADDTGKKPQHLGKVIWLESIFNIRIHGDKTSILELSLCSTRMNINFNIPI